MWSQYPLDEIIEIPLKPPEDILSWLGRIGLLDDEEDTDEDDAAAEPNPGLLEEVPRHPPPSARAPVRRVRVLRRTLTWRGTRTTRTREGGKPRSA